MSKRDEVMQELGEIAKVLNIEIDYIEEDDNGREYLICDDTKICTKCNSISAIRDEFFGYVFLIEWRKKYLGAFDKQTRNYIRQYWYDDEFNQPYHRKEFGY